jgi:hypothetical protein
MQKTRITITIRKDLLKNACEKEINISSFVDIELRKYLAFVENGLYLKKEFDAGNGIRTRVTSLGS